MDKRRKVSGRAVPPRQSVPRVRLRESLLTLIARRPWHRIRVGEVCAHAGVARSTFYQYFAHKEELLLSGFDELKERLSAQSALEGRRQVLSFLPGLAQHAAENRRMFLKLVGCGAGALPASHFRMFVLEMVQEDLFGRKQVAAAQRLKARYIAGGISEVLMWWLQDAPHLPAREICERCAAMSSRGA